MPSDFSVYLTSRLTPGAETFKSFAAPPIVPVTITARITSTWRNVIMMASFAMIQPRRRRPLMDCPAVTAPMAASASASA